MEETTAGKNGLPQCPVETTLIFLNDRESFLTLGYILRGVLRKQKIMAAAGLTPDEYEAAAGKLMEKGLIYENDGELLPTETGKSLESVIKAMARWGEKYISRRGLSPKE